MTVINPNSEFNWRSHSRFEAGYAISYRVAGKKKIEQGELGDISGSGVLIWAEEEIAVGTEISLFVESADPAEPSTEFIATVVRMTPEKNERMMFGYGCRITQTKNSGV